jgi:hypothetical protein
MEKCTCDAGKLRKNREELNASEQGRRCYKARCLGMRAGEKWKTVVPHVGVADEFEL